MCENFESHVSSGDKDMVFVTGCFIMFQNVARSILLRHFGEDCVTNSEKSLCFISESIIATNF